MVQIPRTDDAGWVWVPGYTYSPAQVTWADFDGYIGWAPLPPSGVYLPDPWVVSPTVCWNVVTVRDFHEHEIDKHIVTRISRPQDVNHVIRKAPTVNRIETASNTKVERLKVHSTKVQDGKHSIKQAQLPKEHLQRTQPFRDRINRQVLIAHAHKPH